jgi:hypothetical protein
MPHLTDPGPPLNHVFVDGENVPQINPEVIGTKLVNFTLLLGANQKKLDIGLVEKLIEYAASVQLIRLTSSGRNALDFALAYYIGRAVTTDPTGYIHIVSKDTGFDPLIEHLRSRHIHARRHESFDTLTFSFSPKAAAAAPKPAVALPSPAAPPAAEDSFNRVLEHLRKHGKNRPKRKKTLLTHLKSLLGPDATDELAIQHFEALLKAKRITIGDKDSVSYHV